MLNLHQDCCWYAKEEIQSVQFSWCKVFQLLYGAASEVISLFALSYLFVLFLSTGLYQMEV